ncbi:MAG: Uma2 family endonuclease [Microcoleus sp. PH2017_01_SCD_O_A]|uniref:Uma2 family endonuclease n=1 Tax=unclassified Microcoleus TaxID=2642155 RepID=UPI001DF3987E|nr:MULTISPECIES: Uma2 family endonuclease [unclassified Microcoleus]MCC3419801.1 Uma2 family endonuclease [Microcoleus sp. PH2017_07_MST_O_A]MCC3432055.1 Uma2 family endonuclease [Microcoleus sp. PH2017_04_SCI_O_A]TAE63264.1 MAG: Uma2 family endonuclease [Oscillatoriales cyanobacterium]MCC3427782.1 Uma2 family endonuclease [Microcoleus sp. PH2017_01_SCD_O_A]MCC3456219.1 Uma2 family endonuclease [Microcoleus sp. PH2017_08_TRC_O_A]
MSQSIAPVLEEKEVDNSPTLTFEEYRVYQGDPDVQYELYKGKLIPMATASALHTSICEYLVYKLQRYLAEHNLDLVVKTSVGVRTENATSCIPDVLVCTQSLWEQILAQPGSGILDLGETPLLVVEVVSENRRADYMIKRAQYELANVPEYCIVDPKCGKQKIRILAFIEGEDGYTHTDFFPGEEIISVVFPDLVLSVDEILNPPLVEELVKAERVRLQESQQQAVIERQRADEERQRADEERQRADEERQLAQQQSQRAQEECQRADKLSARLRELGVDPDTVI